MIQTSPLSEAVLPSPFDLTAETARTPISDVPFTALPEPATISGLLLPIITASVAAHLVAVALIGGRLPELPMSGVRKIAHEPVPAIIEEIQIEPAPIEPVALTPTAEPLPSPDAPPSAAQIAPPVLPEIQPVAAVPATVPVAFGIQVKGPVKVVSDPTHASGAAGGGRRPTEPVSVDTAGARNLLLPEITYPVSAKRNRQTGTVLVEFRTSATGDIGDVRVRQSSGHPTLDRAALENLKRGRWAGAPGFFVKAYEFSLQ